MGITVKDLFQYDPNFDPAKIRRLTGKSNYKKTDSVDLSRLAALNDKDLSIFVAKKDRGVINYITDDGMRAQVAGASHVKNVKSEKTDKNEQNNSNVGAIPMDKSIFDIKEKEAV